MTKKKETPYPTCASCTRDRSERICLSEDGKGMKGCATLTGQDILTCGVTGAMMSGLITTMSMEGPRRMAPLLRRIYA